MKFVTFYHSDMKIFLNLLFVVSIINSECPSRLPTYYGNTQEKYLCARTYLGPGSDAVVNGCNPGSPSCLGYEYVDLVDGFEGDADFGLMFPIGSAVVNPGCTLYLFNGYHYQNNAFIYEGTYT